MPCSSDSVRRGNLGKVEIDGTLLARTKTWEVNPSSGESAWGDSDSAGYTNRVPGRLDCTGSMTGVYDFDEPIVAIFMPGDIVEVVLWEAPTLYWDFPCALIRNFRVAYNMDTKEAVEWSADFAADGIFYRPGQSGAPAQSYPS